MQFRVRFLQSLGIVAGLLLGSSFVVPPTMAATITYNFQGTVNHVGNQLSPPPPPFGTTGPSSAMSGSMTVNTSDTASGAVNGSYKIENFEVTIGTYTATYTPATGSFGQVDIRNGAGGAPGADRFIVTVTPLTGDSVRFFAPRLFEIDLRGPNSPSTIFNNDDLPNPAPSIASFTTRNIFSLHFGPGNGNPREVSGVVTSLTAVPLPAAVILFGAGLVALIGLGAGGLRNLRVPEA